VNGKIPQGISGLHRKERTIMRKLISASFLAFALLPVHGLAPLPALAADCQPINSKSASIEKFTNYAPIAAPGSMNGFANTSASGYPAGNFALEDHLAGKAPAVMGAVPQKGGTSDLFGGIYQAVALQKSLGVSKCIKVFAGDRYNSKSNGKSKMDIVTRSVRSKTTVRVNLAQGELRPLGRAPNMKYPRRKIARNVLALAPISLKK
jgi:hypothetical protein